jgi:hypothetical protein
MEAGESSGTAIIIAGAMMSKDAWLILILLSCGAFFLIAGLKVKTFRYKYGGFKVPRIVGGIVYVGLGAMCIWSAIVLALKS